MNVIQIIHEMRNSLDDLYEKKGWKLPMSRKDWNELVEYKECKNVSYEEYLSTFQLNKKELAELKQFKIGIKKMIQDLELYLREAHYTEEKEELRRLNFVCLNCIEKMLLNCTIASKDLFPDQFRADMESLLTDVPYAHENIISDDSILVSYCWYHCECIDFQYLLKSYIKRRPAESMRKYWQRSFDYPKPKLVVLQGGIG